MTIGERIKALRKGKKLTQAAFGKRIGLKATAIGMYEKGERQVSNQSITLISQAFGVREEWLRTGEEPQELPRSSTFLSNPNLGKNDRIIIQMYLELSEEKRQILKDYIASVAKEFDHEDEPPQPVSDAAPTQEERAIAEKVNSYDAAHDNAASSPSKKPDGLTDAEWAMVQQSRTAKESQNEVVG